MFKVIRTLLILFLLPACSQATAAPEPTAPPTSTPEIAAPTDAPDTSPSFTLESAVGVSNPGEMPYITLTFINPEAETLYLVDGDGLDLLNEGFAHANSTGKVVSDIDTPLFWHLEPDMEISLCNQQSQCTDPVTLEGEVGEITLPDLGEHILQGITLPDLDGNPQTITDFPGFTIVNIWGSWCRYCQEEMQYFYDTASAYEEKANFIFIGVGESAKIEKAFLETYGDWPDNALFLLDEKDEYSYGLVPMSLVIRDGQIIKVIPTSILQWSNLVIQEIEKTKR